MPCGRKGVRNDTFSSAEHQSSVQIGPGPGRAALVLSQTLGILLCRYLYGLEPLAWADLQVIEEAIRDVINLQLTRPLS
jgi:hypothetical protein